MRVCVSAFLVTTTPGMKLAGVGRHMLSTLNQLTITDLGHHYDVFLKDDVDMPPEWLACPWITWHRIPVKNSRQRIWWEHFRVGVEAKKLNADVLLSLFVPLPLGCRVPMVSIAHDAFPRTNPDWYPPRKRLILDQMTSYACRKSKAVVTVSEYSRNELCRAYGISKDKVFVAPNGPGNNVRMLSEEEMEDVDLSKYGASNYIFSVSTIEPRKNMDGLIRGFSLLKEKYDLGDLRLLIAGAKGWLDSSIAQVYEESSAKEDIEFLGYVSDLELNALMQKAQLFAFPSYVEGFGIPALEAMTVGTPVMTSNTSSLPEVCGEYASYCDPSSPESICEALHAILSDGAKAKSLVEGGLERAKQFSWDESVKKLEVGLNFAVN
ncbi:MAG: glycosyltransferase family 4 protein [Armatimonadetes bacterium]|nr:glycosyltransferase family 4 protein [Armatimonadota bacterium]